MFIHNGPGEEEADAVTFYIVDVSGGDAVELVENMGLLVWGNADSFVADRQDGAALFLFCDNPDVCPISLIRCNIVGTSQYERVRVSSTVQSYTLTHLRPREVLLKICLDL